VLLPLAFAVLAAQAAGSDAAQRCAAIGEDRARLACYDAIFRKPAAPVASAAAPDAAATPVAVAGPAAAAVPAAAAASSAAAGTVAAAASPEADFGLTDAAKRARDPEKAKEEMPESITGKVAAVARRPAGELTVTLENGQVWTQLTVDQRVRVAAGDTVTIRKAALGSHMLVTANRYGTRVRRVK
jgi:membrane protein implicated in regulation of membrane protease activity